MLAEPFQLFVGVNRTGVPRIFFLELFFALARSRFRLLPTVRNEFTGFRLATKL